MPEAFTRTKHKIQPPTAGAVRRKGRFRPGRPSSPPARGRRKPPANLVTQHRKLRREYGTGGWPAVIVNPEGRKIGSLGHAKAEEFPPRLRQVLDRVERSGARRGSGRRKRKKQIPDAAGNFAFPRAAPGSPQAAAARMPERVRRCSLRACSRYILPIFFVFLQNQSCFFPKKRYISLTKARRFPNGTSVLRFTRRSPGFTARK